MHEVSFRIGEDTINLLLDFNRPISDVYPYLKIEAKQIDTLFAVMRNCVIEPSSSFNDNKIENNEIIKVRLR